MSNAHALGKLFHLIKSSFSQASNRTLVLTIHIKLAKKLWILLMKGSEKIEMYGNVPVFDM